jgi:uncharacterized protein (AIM24 family)
MQAPGVKTALSGGEGLFFATLAGPARVMRQTMPLSRLAHRIIWQWIVHADSRQ